ncbi:MAG: MaoC family dehydratase [Novipirellula sp. JB048]
MNHITEIKPLFLEDMQVGDRWSSPWREISGDDVADFARLTGDHDSLHSSESVASPFGEPVAHGLLGLSVLAGLGSDHPNAATLALVGISDWQFEAPIFFGDHVQVITEVEQIQTHGRRAGRVTWFRQLVNQQGRVVQCGRFVTLVATRSRARPLGTSTPARRAALPPR